MGKTRAVKWEAGVDRVVLEEVDQTHLLLTLLLDGGEFKDSFRVVFEQPFESFWEGENTLLLKSKK
jgi:hypothetical protein